LTISRLSRWSISYYNDTARQAVQDGLDRQRANGGLGEYYSEGDTRTPTWLIAGDAARTVELVGLDRRACPPQDCVSNGYRLGAGIGQQRLHFAKGTLRLERRDRLCKLPGWEWEPHKAKWEQGFRRLQQYVDQHGDAQVEAKYTTADGYRLGAWVARQRRKHSSGALDPDRCARLDKIKGWQWRIGTGNWTRDRWRT